MLVSKQLSFYIVGHEDAFTYSEVLVSIALIAVVVLGFSLNTIGVIQGNRRSADFTIATNLAQDRMEQLKAHPSLGNTDRCPDLGERAISATGASGGIYDRCWTIKDSSLGSGLKEITVTVKWRDSEPRALTLSTLVFSE